MATDLSGIRNEYRRGNLDKSHVNPDPVKQFAVWMEQAFESGIEEPTAMTLATADSYGKPSARMVLLKGFDQSGFTFYTNYLSRKADQLKMNPYAALVLYWKELERQVRIEGRIEKVSPVESDEYFAARPRESQVSAIISPQSTIIPDRQYLIEMRDDYLVKHPKKHHRPLHWGGYRLKPGMIEFWQGRPGRLHDRIRYLLSESDWIIERLAP
jgi:pyridoxamine 5'-phosphate oxidase